MRSLVRFASSCWLASPGTSARPSSPEFGALPQLVATEETWQPLPDWIGRAADAGHRFTISDLLIASLAAEIGGLVWSLDKDFERMEQLGLVSLYAPSPIS